MRREIQAHGPRLEEVLERAGALASLRSPEAEAVRRGQEQLQGAWAGLREAAERRQQVLDAAFQVEQYYFDVAEVEAWLGEQELLMMSEDKGKVRPGWRCGGPGRGGGGDGALEPGVGRCHLIAGAVCPQDEQSTLQLLKKHLQLEQGVENYEESIAQLSRQCRALLEMGHPDRWAGPVLREWSGRIWSFAVGNWGRARTGRWDGRVGSLLAPCWCFRILASGWGPRMEERCARMFERVGPGALGF